MGTVITMPLAGVLAEYIGWDAIFYVFGNLISIRRKYYVPSLSSSKHIFSNLFIRINVLTILHMINSPPDL